MSRAPAGGFLAAALVATTLGGAWYGVLARRRRDSAVAALAHSPAIPPPFAGLALPGSGDPLVAAISRPGGGLDPVAGSGPQHVGTRSPADRTGPVRPAWVRRLEDLEDSIGEERTA